MLPQTAPLRTALPAGVQRLSSPANPDPHSTLLRLQGKVSLCQLARQWAGSYAGNALGCALGVALLLGSGVVKGLMPGVTAVSLAKISYPLHQTFVSCKPRGAGRCVRFAGDVAVVHVAAAHVAAAQAHLFPSHRLKACHP